MGANRDSLAAEAFDDANRGSADYGDALAGPSYSLDSTLPPTTLHDLLVADGATIYVLSSDAQLIQAVERAGGEQFPIHVVANWAALVDAATGRRLHVVLLDADALPVALPEAVARLRDVAPLLVVLVAARGDAAQSVMSLLAERSIHRLLIKPAAEGITRLLLESAIGRYLRLRDEHELPVVVDDDDIRPHRRYREKRPDWTPWLHPAEERQVALASGLAAAVIGAVIVGELYGVQWRQPLDRLSASAPAVDTRGAVPAVGQSGSRAVGQSGSRAVGQSDEIAPSASEQPPTVREGVDGAVVVGVDDPRQTPNASRIDSERPVDPRAATDASVADDRTTTPLTPLDRTTDPLQ